MPDWPAAQLASIGAAEELQIAVRRADGTLRRWTPIWVVTTDRQVYVRTWHRRETGWYGAVLESGRARIKVPEVETDVVVEDIGEGSPTVQAGIDDAYRSKYARYGRSSVSAMVAPDAAAATLRLRPDGARAGS